MVVQAIMINNWVPICMCFPKNLDMVIPLVVIGNNGISPGYSKCVSILPEKSMRFEEGSVELEGWEYLSLTGILVQAEPRKGCPFGGPHCIKLNLYM